MRTLNCVTDTQCSDVTHNANCDSLVVVVYDTPITFCSAVYCLQTWHPHLAHNMEKETVKVVRHTGDSLETKNEDTVGPEVSKRFRNSIASFAFAGTPNLCRSPRSLIPKGSPKSTLPCNDTPRRRKRSESKLAITVHDDETTMDSFEPESSNSSKSPASSKKVKRSYAPPEMYSHLGGLKDRLEENLDGEYG